MHERQMKYYSVRAWLEAGRPLDESFLIVRESMMDVENIDEDTTMSTLTSLAALIVHAIAGYRDDVNGSSYRLDPAPSTLHDTWLFDYEDFTFSVQVDSSIIPRSTKVRISMGAIATILSE